MQFFHDQGFVIVSTLDSSGDIHNSCKGVVDIKRSGKIYLLDLYLRKTFKNLKRNPRLSITAVDEHRFRGFCLKGKAKLIERDKVNAGTLKAWEDKIASRITQRIIKNIHGEKGHARQPEVLLPKPAYLIEMQVNDIIDLTPQHIK